MRKIDYKEGRELEKTHVCKECGGGLVTAWHSPAWYDNDTSAGSHVIKCSENNEHEGETKKRWAREQPTYIRKDNIRGEEWTTTIERKERNGRK